MKNLLYLMVSIFLFSTSFSSGQVNLTSEKGTIEITPKESSTNIEVSNHILSNLEVVFIYIKEQALKCTVINFKSATKEFNDINTQKKLLQISRKAKEHVDIKSFNDNGTFATAIEEILILENELVSLINMVADSTNLNMFTDLLTEIQEELNRGNILKVATLQTEICFYVLELSSKATEEAECRKVFNCLLFAFRELSKKFSSSTAREISIWIGSNIYYGNSGVCDNQQNLKNFVQTLNFQEVAEEVEHSSTEKSYNSFVNAINDVNNTLSIGDFGTVIFSLSNLCSVARNLEKIRLVRVPTVIGININDAKKLIERAGLTVGTLSTVIDNTKPAGTVVSQSPVGGTKVVPGTTVNLVYTEKQQLITVPNLIGTHINDAIKLIEKIGLTVGEISTQVNTSETTGTVVDQSPQAGTKVVPGTPINLTKAVKPLFVTVPNLIGHTLNEAKDIITGLGLVVGNIEYFSDPIITPGLVVEQGIVPGTEVLIGTTIDLLVSQ